MVSTRNVPASATPTGQHGTQRTWCLSSPALNHHSEGDQGMTDQDGMSNSIKPSENREVAVLAGGCFWGVEEILREVPGVIDTEVGYTGGWLENPTYADTHHSKSGHAE